MRNPYNVMREFPRQDVASVVAQYVLPRKRSIEATTLKKHNHMKSRKATPWDGMTDLTPTEEYIRDHHQEHYRIHHQTLGEDMESSLLNSRKPERCSYCGSKDFIRFGHNASGVQVYRCRSCGRRFTVLTGTIFDSHKIPISEWIEFLYNLFSFVSLTADSWNNKNAFTTSKYWLEKVFLLVGEYQKGIKLKGDVVLDETFYPVRSEETVWKDGKKLRGLSVNQICIGVACDNEHVFCVLEGKGKPSQGKTWSAFKDHIENGSVLIHDKENAHKTLVSGLGLTSMSYDAREIKKLDDRDNPLERVNRIHFLLKRFFMAHSSFKREYIGGFIDLFSFVMNPPSEKLEKVKVLLDLGLTHAQILRFRDDFLEIKHSD